ncbi:MAG: ImmA/IrrE family metallo-endopeptidase [Lachnospiraceae bacterium]|nr:ImmA/IrrE family metallo-endopeptidase [Lachnospiraceae bacterium]
MRLDNETYEDIKQAVADMFVDYDIKGVPISSFEVAIKIGLTVIPYSAMDSHKKDESMDYSKDGFSVETLCDEWIIYYNDQDKNYGRINQTIMHEVGHYILGHIEEGEIEESEAKFFAKYALASPPLIHNLLEDVNEINIMNTFDIGYEAAMFAVGYYRKWLRYGEKDYVSYETQILEQLEVDVA